MTGYTKLFGSIIASTIWDEDNATRVVWVTMLAMANQRGEVEASIPGLAKLSKVTIEEVECAIQKFKTPDKYSRTKDHEGRRIKDIDGGWLLLNHSKYRAKMSQDQRREYQREYWHKRKTQLPLNTTQQNSTDSIQAEAEAEAEAEQKKSTPTRPSLEEIKLACSKGGLREADGEWFFYKCEGNGWTNGGKPIKKWWATLKSWEKGGYLPSQRNGSLPPKKKHFDLADLPP